MSEHLQFESNVQDTTDNTMRSIPGLTSGYGVPTLLGHDGFLQLLQPRVRFFRPFRIGMIENDPLIQFLSVGNVCLPFLKLCRFKKTFRTLSATADHQTQGEKRAHNK